jgi:transcriptional regulator with XRE-family HTH domain
VDDLRVGALIRAIRQRRGWRQEDLADAARLSRSQVSRAERGHLAELRLAHLRSIAEALEVRLWLAPAWRGGEADRVLNERHGLMHERLATMFAGLPGWRYEAEVTFSVYGERGSIDALAWQPARRSLLVVELKTEILDPAALVAQVDRYRRLATGIGRERGWDPASVSTWVLVADSSMNRRRLARHRTLLRNAFPTEGRAMRSWLRRPAGHVDGPVDGPVAALSFMANNPGGSTVQKAAPTRRISGRIRGSRAPETVANAPDGVTRQGIGAKPAALLAERSPGEH